MTTHIKMSQPVLTESAVRKIVRGELQRELKGYVGRRELKQILSNYPTKADLKREFAASEKRLSQELTRHVNAILDESRRITGAVDEKYNNIPDRVTKLELTVGIER